MVRVAVTGSTGFLGRHVIEALAAQAVDTVAMRRPGGPDRPWLDNVEIVEIDIAKPPADPFAAMGHPDVVIHLAWGGLPNYKSLHHFEAEMPAHYAFLERLVHGGLQRLVVTGTCLEYGMETGPLAETRPAAPQNPYACAKDGLRQQLESLQAARPFALCWARLFYMYGEGQAANSLVPQLERALLAGDQSFDMSGGEQLRDYLAVEQVAADLVYLALHDADVGIVNICSGAPVSVRTFVEDWLDRRGARIALNLGHYPYPDYEPMAFWGDRRKFESIIATTRERDNDMGDFRSDCT